LGCAQGDGVTVAGGDCVEGGWGHGWWFVTDFVRGWLIWLVLKGVAD